MCDHIWTVTEAVEEPVPHTAKACIGTEDELAAVKITDNFVFKRPESELLVLVSGIDVKSQRKTVCIHEKTHGHDRVGSVFFAFAILPVSTFLLGLEVVVGAIVVQDLRVPVMHKVRIPIKFFLNVIWLFCHNRKSAVNILQWILRWLQKRMTEWITAHLAWRWKYPGIDKVCKDGVQIVCESMAVAYVPADVVYPQLTA